MMITSMERRRALSALDRTESRPSCASGLITSPVNSPTLAITSPASVSHACRLHSRAARRWRIGPLHHAALEVARHSIPIAERRCSGLVQGIFCPPSRRAIICLLSEPIVRRAAGQKMLCLIRPRLAFDCISVTPLSRLDLIVLTKDESLAQRAPPASQFEPATLSAAIGAG